MAAPDMMALRRFIPPEQYFDAMNPPELMPEDIAAYAPFVAPQEDVYAEPPLPEQAPPQQFAPAPKPSFGQRLRGALPSLLVGGIAGAATPNVGEGGAVDMFRAANAGLGAATERDILDYRMRREREMDEAERQRRLAMAKYYSQGGFRGMTPKKPQTVEEQLYEQWQGAPTRELRDAAWTRLQEYKHGAQKPPTPARPVSVAPGGTLVDPSTGKTLFTAPAKAPTGEAAKVAQLAQGYVDLGFDEKTANTKARQDYREYFVAGTNLRDARTVQANAAAGSANATTAHTQTDTEKDVRTKDVQRAADLAISQEQTQDPNRARVNVLNPEFYKGWDEQTRAEVSAEIQRRIDAKARGGSKKGYGSTLKGGAPTGGHPAGNPKPKPVADPLGIRG